LSITVGFKSARARKFPMCKYVGMKRYVLPSGFCVIGGERSVFEEYHKLLKLY